MFRHYATPYAPGQAGGVLRFGPAAAGSGVIVVLRQREITALTKRPAGIILIEALPFAHPTLRLLSRAIPTVLAEFEDLQGLVEGTEIFLDGSSGVLVSPVPQDQIIDATPDPPEAGKPLHTLDGEKIELRASIGSVEAAGAAVKKGAASIGLVRSEYLFPEDGRQPDAGFLSAAFSQICLAARPLPVTFRLVDISGDKIPPWAGSLQAIGGKLGLQGSRLYAMEPVRQVFLDELAALGNQAGESPIRVLLPYIASLPELERLVKEIRQHMSPAVSLGVMLETPAVALAAEEFLSVVDFVALGCNDLMQCLFAADRDLYEVRDCLDPHAPALYRFLDMVAQRAGNSAGTIQVCGLLPQWPGILPVMLGMGYRVFSVDPVMIPWLARVVRNADINQAVVLARSVIEARHPAEVRKILAVFHGISDPFSC